MSTHLGPTEIFNSFSKDNSITKAHRLEVKTRLYGNANNRFFSARELQSATPGYVTNPNSRLKSSIGGIDSNTPVASKGGHRRLSPNRDISGLFESKFAARTREQSPVFDKEPGRVARKKRMQRLTMLK